MDNKQVLEEILPDQETVKNYKQMESLSINRVNELLKAPNLDADGKGFQLASLAHKLLKTVNNFRGHMRSEVNLTLKLFKDISGDKEELKAYIKATYPKIIRKETK